MEMERGIKQEDHSTSRADVKPEVAMNQSQVDFSKLYGDLCRKLLSTPVGEIFPEVVAGSASPHVTNSTGRTTTNSVHPAFPALSTMPTTSMNYMPGLYSPEHLLMMAGGFPNELNTSGLLNNSYSNPTPGGASIKNGVVEMTKNASISPGSDVSTDYMENIDVQKLVDEFRITLERFGVSQRFAARFIMQDTSQGNLSFLMEKGRNKRWEELSPRGRLPYIKMKAWLESKEQQMATLEMLKYSQESRKNSCRESYSRRERFTMFQLNVLCRLFEENSNPPMNIRNSVAIRLGIPLDRVNVWFQNQRARGFPARKILQQSLFENESDPYLAIDVENMKDKINEAHLIPQNVSTKVESPTYRRKSEQGRSKRSSPTTNVIASPIPTGVLTSVKQEADEMILPLDLSSSSVSDKNRTFETNSPSTHVPIKEERNIYTEALNYETQTTPTNPPTFQSNLAKSGTSGAAKRKRGSKPQQIIPLYKRRESENNSNCDTSTETKRRRVSEISSPESKYTYLLDTSDVEHESQCQNGYQSNGYDYVIKTETSPDNKGFRYNSPENKHLNERSFRESSLTGQKEKYLDSDRYEVLGHDNGDVFGDKNALLNTKNINATKEETMNPKSVEIFKAMCASLAIKDQNQSDTNVSEPELD